MRVLLSVLAMVAISLVWSAAVQAATIKVVSGDVYRGGPNGYDPVDLTAQADVGDSVMAGEYGVGQIIYANGCVVPVRPGTVVTVEAQPPASCQVAASETTTVEPTGASLPTGQVLLGTAIAGGIGVGIYALSSGGGDDNGGGDKPVSP